jgi:hypothetical protein
MIREFVDIIRNNNVDAALGVFHLSDFQYFHVITSHIICKLEWRNIYDIDIRIFNGKNSCYLSVFSLKEFFHGDSFEFVHGVRVDMYLDSFLSFDILPPLLELFLHFPP